MINHDVMKDIKQRVSRGRIEIKINGKWLTRSRVFMEHLLGRTLNKKEIVHHIDGNKLNDSLENLTVMSLSDHITLHNKQRDWTRLKQRVNEKNPNWKGENASDHAKYCREWRRKRRLGE